MTTDITELAQRMKAAAEKATPGPWYVHDKPCEDGNYGIDTSDKEFLAEAVVWWGFARQSIWREEDAKYIALANPANILALVEALEKAQTINAAQDDHINQQQDRIDQLEKGHQEAAKQINSWRRMAKQNIAEREKDIAELDAARQRIAELESRTVTVKLPQAVSAGGQGYQEKVERILTAAGIKWEAE
ncbi:MULTISPECIES: ead/Ea22-like family protein [Klebsiella pneumoniae complex]|uniref:ead/Ea22-like family protein n=1 Tax=Klebsiella pneumoniae complex TaxID=3390273 RepID=UPI000C9B3D11|nr:MULTISPECIES: ead/Ea22-like family protein [Klebsiella]MDW7484924.1 ead/Ea22-like family protein [Klebsiella pneumoniae]MEC5276346.1 ead/Ea22-like family protein [Klebsiella pneumoniae]HDU2894845.1 ead/Ea22-like family protein [Klebsiella variicola]